MYKLTVFAVISCFVCLAEAQQVVTEDMRITSFDSEGLDRFGGGLAISGDRVFVGAPSQRSDTSSSVGAVYVFDRYTGEQVDKFAPDDLGYRSFFGYRMLIHQDTLVIGSSHSIYVYDPQTLDLLRVITPDDSPDSFSPFDVSGDLLVVGASQDDEAEYNAGAIYVFDFQSGDQIRKIFQPEVGQGFRFGDRISVEGTTIATSSLKHFRDGDLILQRPIFLVDAMTGDLFDTLYAPGGVSMDGCVELHDQIILGGAPSLGDTRGEEVGAVFQFDRASRQYVRKLVPRNAVEFQRFGGSCLVHESSIYVGGPGDPNEPPLAGAVYIMDLATGIQTAELRSSLPVGSVRTFYGVSFTFDGELGLVGESQGMGGAGNYTGAVYFHTLPEQSCIADFAVPFGTLNFFDVSEFVSMYGSGDPVADLAAPFGTLNFFDVSAYISAYNAGCP